MEERLMKKRISFILILALAAVMLAGCTGDTVVYYTECNCPTAAPAPIVEEAPAPVKDEAPAAQEEVVADTEPVAEGALKTGMAIVAGIGDSENAKQAKYDVTLVAVTVDDAGVIHNCIIDGLGATVEFDATGTIASDTSAAVQTKTELGDNYGMVAYGGAKHEWYQQAGALADYAVGKTVDELKNGAIDETGKAPEGTDLASTATIYLGGYVSAIEEAVNNAQHLGAQAGDELRLASISNLGSSASATAEAAGVAQLDCDVTALTVKDGVITSCMIDSLQAKVAFDATGAITTDLSAPVQTKNQLGEGYGMKAWGGAAYEWNEQAASFAAYATGKTAEQVSGIAVTDGKATEADLASSVTISIGGFQALIEKAMQ